MPSVGKGRAKKKGVRTVYTREYGQFLCGDELVDVKTSMCDANLLAKQTVREGRWGSANCWVAANRQVAVSSLATQHEPGMDTFVPSRQNTGLEQNIKH